MENWDCQRVSRCFLNLLSNWISVTTLSQFCPLVITSVVFLPAAKHYFQFCPVMETVTTKYSITDRNRNEGFSYRVYICRHSTLWACDGPFHYSRSHHM